MITVEITARPLPPLEIVGDEQAVVAVALSYVERAVRLGCKIHWSAKDREALAVVRQARNILKASKPFKERFQAASRVREAIHQTIHATTAEMWPCRPVTRCPTEKEMIERWRAERGLA